MKPYALEQRARFYNEKFKKWPASHLSVSYVNGREWLQGMWIMGNNYRTSGYYGAYPHTYLDRVMSLFPDAQRVLHLFSGSLPKGNYTRFDRFANPSSAGDAEMYGDAERLSLHCGKNRFDLIPSDPPYSIEDCEHYGCPMVNRNKILAECVKVMEPGGFVVWLDQVLPMFRKVELEMCGVIGMVKSTNHRFRVVTLFKKKG